MQEGAEGNLELEKGFAPSSLSLTAERERTNVRGHSLLGLPVCSAISFLGERFTLPLFPILSPMGNFYIELFLREAISLIKGVFLFIS